MTDEDVEIELKTIETTDGQPGGWSDKTTGKYKTAGIKALADGDTVSHGLGSEPDEVQLTSEVKGLLAAVTTLTTNTFTVGLMRINAGTDTATNGSGSFSHGLGEAPGVVLIVAAGADRLARWTSKGTAVVTYEVQIASTGAAPSGDDDVDWIAIVFPSQTENVHWEAIK